MKSWFVFALAPALVAILAPACAIRSVPSSFPGAAYCGAIEPCEAACQKGDARACGYMAQAALAGAGMPRSAKEAIAYATRGCEGNDGRSCTTLGVVYFAGMGVERNWARTAELNGKACDLGFAIGCNSLGLAYRDGHGVEADVPRANALFAKACDGGAALGCLQLALGTPDKLVPEDRAAKALPLLVHDCDPAVNPDVRVCTVAARMVAGGRGAAPDAGKARALYTKACGRGDPAACDAVREESHGR